MDTKNIENNELQVCCFSYQVHTVSQQFLMYIMKVFQFPLLFSISASDATTKPQQGITDYNSTVHKEWTTLVK